MSLAKLPDTASRRPILAAALFIACLYLPTLATPFDFVDDGNLVYPLRSSTLNEKARFYWQSVVANYEDLGPFRPTLWAHWRVEAELFGANPFVWRAARFVFTVLASAAFLTLLLDLEIAWTAAVFTAALAMWNPYRNEIWTSLTFSEGVAMPYAIAALVCARRAARAGAGSWRWDVGGAACMLVALGCKNTFAAVVPVQLFFRVTPTGTDVVAGLRRNWARVCLLSLTLALPLIHYAVFISHWHQGQYEVGGHIREQLRRMLRVERRAISLELMAAGFILSLLAVARDDSGDPRMRTIWRTRRAPLLAGLMLFAFGVGIYLPIGGVGGRYAIPAVWGLDLWIGVLASELVDVSPSALKRLAVAALAVGVLAVAVSNVIRQSQFAARARLLWQVARFVETELPRGEAIAWIGSKTLGTEEGIHFAWHLQHRNYSEIDVHLFDAAGTPRMRRELTPRVQMQRYAVSGEEAVPLAGTWKRLREFDEPYRLGYRRMSLTVWQLDRGR